MLKCYVLPEAMHPFKSPTLHDSLSPTEYSSEDSSAPHHYWTWGLNCQTNMQRSPPHTHTHAHTGACKRHCYYSKKKRPCLSLHLFASRESHLQLNMMPTHVKILWSPGHNEIFHEQMAPYMAHPEIDPTYLRLAPTRSRCAHLNWKFGLSWV